MSAPPDESAAGPKWQFSLRTMLIALGFAALLCAPPAYWGWSGAAASVVLLGIVVAVALHLYGRLTLVELLVLIAVCGMLVAVMLPAVHSRPRTPAWRNACINNMKQIVLAMHLYHQDHGSFPPAYVADDQGRPLHSWRSLLLPYLEQKKAYDQIRWDEPWNSPHNSRIASGPGIYADLWHCPADGGNPTSGNTSYVVVTGDGTAFPGDQTTTLDDIRDGTANTILIVEVANSGIHWMEPRDLNLQQMATTINAQAGQGISSCHNGGAVCALADSSVHFLSETLSAQELRAMLTIDGGETVTLP